MPQIFLLRAVTAAVLICLLAGSAFGKERAGEEPAAEDRRALVISILGALAIFEKVPPQPLRDLFHGAPRQEQPAPRRAKPAPAVPAAMDPDAEAVSEPPRLIAIVITDNLRAAYFQQNGAGRSVEEGDALDDRYQVVRIEPKKVLLRDLATGFFQTIDWSDDR